jgi:hypothetical protein
MTNMKKAEWGARMWGMRNRSPNSRSSVQEDGGYAAYRAGVTAFAEKANAAPLGL